MSIRIVPQKSKRSRPERLPDEDWTEIADLAARRKVQNRNAQRRYRRKPRSCPKDSKKYGTDRSFLAENKHKHRTIPPECIAGSFSGIKTDKPITIPHKSMKQWSVGSSATKIDTIQADSLSGGKFSPATVVSNRLAVESPSFDEREHKACPSSLPSRSVYPAPDGTFLQPCGANQPYPVINADMPSFMSSIAHFIDDLEDEIFANAEKSSYDSNSKHHGSAEKLANQA